MHHNNNMYIYIIEAKENKIKIGISKDPEKRLKQLQTGSFDKLKLVYKVEVKKEQSRYLEKKIHHNNNFNRINGEWFCISKQTAISEVDHAIIRYGDETI